MTNIEITHGTSSSILSNSTKIVNVKLNTADQQVQVTLPNGTVQVVQGA